MNAPIPRWCRGLARHPWRGVLAILLAAAVFLPRAKDLVARNELEVWLAPGEPETDLYHRLREEFGSDRWVVALLEGGPLSPERAKELDGALGDLGVGLVAARGPVPMEGDPPGSLLFLLLPRQEETALRAADAVARIEERLGRAAGPAVRLRLAGPVAIEAALDRISQGEAMRLLPLSALLGAGILAWRTRRWRAAAGLLLLLLASVSISWGIFLLLGGHLDMVTAILAPLLLIIGLANEIHLLDRTDEFLRAGAPREEAVAHALADVAVPGGYASLTTAGGLLTLTTSDVGPVASFGWGGAIGVCVALVVAYLGHPWVARWAGPPPAQPPGDENRWTRLARIAPRHPRAILLAAFLLALLAGKGLSNLSTEATALEFLPLDEPALAATRAVEARGYGFSPVEILIEGDLAGHEAPIEEFLARAQAIPGASGVEYEAGAAAGPGLARVLLHAPSLPSAKYEDFLAEVSRETRRLAAETGLAASIGGAVPLWVGIGERILSSQRTSLLLSIAEIALALFLVAPTRRIALLSILPNVLPALAALGLFGWLGRPINAGTVLVGALVIGIAVDDTVHLLWSLKSSGGSLEKAWARLGSTVTATNLALSASLGLFVLSRFGPMREFGVLAAGGLTLAWLAELFLLPALLAGGGILPRQGASNP